MNRTELLQEIRKMRFEEAYAGWQGGRLRQEEAARLLGVCERTFRRYVDRYEDEGLPGLRVELIRDGRLATPGTAKRAAHAATPGSRSGCKRRARSRRRPRAASTASAGSERRGRGCCYTRTRALTSGCLA